MEYSEILRIADREIMILKLNIVSLENKIKELEEENKKLKGEQNG